MGGADDIDPQLLEELISRGLSTEGDAKELRKRLMAAIKRDKGAKAETNFGDDQGHVNVEIIGENQDAKNQETAEEARAALEELRASIEAMPEGPEKEAAKKKLDEEEARVLAMEAAGKEDEEGKEGEMAPEEEAIAEEVEEEPTEPEEVEEEPTEPEEVEEEEALKEVDFSVAEGRMPADKVPQPSTMNSQRLLTTPKALHLMDLQAIECFLSMRFSQLVQQAILILMASKRSYHKANAKEAMDPIARSRSLSRKTYHGTDRDDDLDDDPDRDCHDSDRSYIVYRFSLILILILISLMSSTGSL